MKPSISKHAMDYRRRKSPIREIMDYANPATFAKFGVDVSDVISFVGGWVGHEAPELLRDVYRRIASDPLLFHTCGSYSPTLGTEECRAAIVEFERHLYGIDTLNPAQVAVGANSSQQTQALMRVLLDAGDKILVLDPTYCNFPLQLVSAVDAQIVRFPVLVPESCEYVAEERIAAFVRMIEQERPKVILLVSPDNPTSKVLPDAFVQAAVDAARAIGSFVLLDFAYKEIVFRRPVPAYFGWGPSDNVIMIRSNSKWCRGLGRRLGWIEAPEFVVEALEAIQSAAILAPDMLHQMAFTRFIGESIAQDQLRPYVQSVGEMYRHAADATVSAIQQHTHRPHTTPDGGLYSVIHAGRNGALFVEELLRRTGVLLVPGWGFGDTMKDCVRLSYGPLVGDISRIRAGIERIGRFLES